MSHLKDFLLVIWGWLTTPMPIAADTELEWADRPSSERTTDDTTCKGDVNSIACQIEYGDELDAWHQRDRNPLDDENEKFEPWK